MQVVIQRSDDGNVQIVPKCRIMVDLGDQMETYLRMEDIPPEKLEKASELYAEIHFENGDFGEIRVDLQGLLPYAPYRADLIKAFNDELEKATERPMRPSMSFNE